MRAIREGRSWQWAEKARVYRNKEESWNRTPERRTLRHAEDGYGERGTLRHRLDTHDQRTNMVRVRPGRRSGRLERDDQMLARLIFTAAAKTQTLVGNVHGHGFFKPRDVFGTHANRQGQPAPRAGATLQFSPVAVAVRVWARGDFKAESRRRHVRRFGVLRGVSRSGLFPTCRRPLSPTIRRWNTLLRKRGANDSREDFRLAVRNRSVVREGDPQGHARRVAFVAGNKHTTTTYVQRSANLRFLAEGRRPAKSGGNPELDAMMLASVHKPPQYVRVNPGVTPSISRGCTNR